MNKNLFRIIFNARRGQRMAVAETAGSQGKGKGDTPTTSKALVGAIFTILFAACAFAAIGLLSQVHAQIVADPSAPGSQRPTVLAAPNGVPLVNITTPSAAGVSVNKLIQFDVQRNGAILNNSRTNVQTQLGGWVPGNPWLAGGSASKIVNQVNSSNPSYLNGYVEVAGQRAEVIIANPSGIRVNGGGFINADRVTLTTGLPVINNGSLESYRVTGGTIAIEGLGLDTRNASYTDIMARAVEVNAGLWANYLKVTTGANEVNAANTIATPIAGTGAKPNFMLDVAAIGGMYAGHIYIVGTEAGLGVRNAGAIGASAGQAVLLANGWVTNTGAIQAAGNLQINAAGSISNTGANAVISAQGGVNVATGGNLTNLAGATIAASGALSVAATGAVQNSQSTIAANGAVSLNAASLSNESGRIASVSSSLAIATTGTTSNTVASGSTQGSSLGAAGALSLSNTGLTNTASSIVGGSVTIDTNQGALDNSAGTISAGGAASITSGALTNSAGLIQAAGGALDINTHDQALVNTSAAGHSSGAGGIVAQGPFTLRTGDLDNTAGYLGASGAITVTAAQINNSAAGKIIGESSLAVAATGLNNQTGQVQALGDVAINLGAGILDNTAGLIRSGANASLNAAAVTNSNTSGSDQGIEGNNVLINAATLSNNSGAIRAGNNATLTSSGSINNTSGLISAGNAATLQDRATSRTLAITNTGGTAIAGQALTVNAASLTGDGKLLSQQDLSLALSGDFSNTGEVIANRDATVTTTGDISNSGKLQAGRTLSATAQNINNSASGEISAVNTTLTAGATLTNRGLIDGVQARLNAATLNNIGTGRIYGDQLAIAATTLNNAPDSAAPAVAPVIAARERLDLGVHTLNNSEHALVFSGGTGTNALNVGGALDANGQAAGQATTVNNASATIESLGGLTINAAQINNTNNHFSTQVVPVSSTPLTEYQIVGSPNRYTPGQISLFVDEELVLSTPEGVSYWVGFNRYDYTRNISETQVASSDPGQILSGGAMRLTAGSVLNDKSRIIAGGALSGSIGSLTNTEAPGERVTTDSGTVTNHYRIYNRRGDSWGTATAAYAPAAIVQAISLAPTRFDANTAPTGSGTQVIARASASTGQTASATGAASARVNVLSINGPGSLPASSLFRQNPAANARYLVETDPRFASYRTWLGSDYMLQALSYDPATVQKRLGDGFYEQKLIREQVAQLTGQRFLDGYASDEAQYRALMNAGVTFAQSFQLRPGIALSAAQMAQLTSDIVWLVEQEVTLADGSTQKVLVPQVYVRLQEGDLAPSGGLLAGRSIDLNLTGDLTNAGTIAGRDVVKLTAQNIQNLGGRIAGETVSATARDDLNNIGGQINAKTSLLATAGRDLNIASTTSTQTGSQGSRTNIDRVAGLYVSEAGGTLVASAGRDANIIAGVISNSGAGGSTVIAAGNNLNLGAVNESSSNAIRWNANNFRTDSQSQEVGSQINTTGNLQLSAGSDINARAAQITSTQGALTVSAGNSVNITAGQSSQSVDEGHQSTSKGFLSSKTITTRETLDRTDAVGSSLSGNTVTVLAGQDINVKGSSIVSDTGTTLIAGNNLNIEAAQNTFSSTSERDEKKSGIFSGGGLSITAGKQQQSTDTDNTRTSAAASTVGSIGGNVTLQAGESYRQVGSDVLAPGGDISIVAKKVDIVEARETSRSVTEQKFSQSGVTLAITSPVITAVQTAQQMSQTAGDTSDSRVQLLAAANVALAANNAAKAVDRGQGSFMNGKEGQVPTGGKNPDGTSASRDANAADAVGGINLAITIGGSKSQSTSSTQSDTARGSSVTAGGNVAIVATGAGQGSNLTIQGSAVDAGKTAMLLADNQINLLAAKNEASQTSSNSASSGSIGVSFGTDGFMVNASASQARGNADGADTSYSNSRVTAGGGVAGPNGTVILQSGSDTTLQGAVIAANQVRADVGGNLKVESLQDTSTFTSAQKSAGGSISVGVGNISGSVNLAKSNIDSDFKSVGEQSGIKAGNGGFQVNVAGDTDLQGGVIASTQAAVDNSKNTFTTGGALTTSDIQNTASYSAQATGISVGAGYTGSTTSLNGTGVGMGSDKDEASSTSSAGISGIAGNTAVSSTDAETGIKPIFDADKVQREINAQVAITQAFSKEATKAVGTYAAEKLKAAEANNDQAEIDKWKEGGSARVALHVLVGGLGGGVGGAIGSGASSVSVPYIAAAVNSTELPEPVRAGLIAAAGAALGASVGGGYAGAAAAFTEVINNCLASTCLSIKWDKNAPGYHQYGPLSTPNLCNVSLPGCMSAVQAELSCNSAPGQPGCTAPGTTRDSINLVALPGTQNVISQYVSPNNQVVINGTNDNHMFNDGYVLRWVSVDAQGYATIKTYGEGVNQPWNGASAGTMAATNAGLGVSLFTGLGFSNLAGVQNRLTGDKK